MTLAWGRECWRPLRHLRQQLHEAANGSTLQKQLNNRHLQSSVAGGGFSLPLASGCQLDWQLLAARLRTRWIVHPVDKLQDKHPQIVSKRALRIFCKTEDGHRIT